MPVPVPLLVLLSFLNPGCGVNFCFMDRRTYHRNLWVCGYSTYPGGSCFGAWGTTALCWIPTIGKNYWKLYFFSLPRRKSGINTTLSPGKGCGRLEMRIVSDLIALGRELGIHEKANYPVFQYLHRPARFQIPSVCATTRRIRSPPICLLPVSSPVPPFGLLA